jgi:glycosyltransferase involved in cell wall biosynthesis
MRDRPSVDWPSVDWPSVDVVVPTCNRPELLRQAVAAIRAQDYPGPLSVIVVVDGQPPDRSLAGGGPVPVRVLTNERAPGLAGSRNTGILAASADLVAFCDDDDRWLAGKLSRQVTELLAEPGAEVATTSILVEFGNSRSPRTAGRTRVEHGQLLRSRMAMLHSSTFLAVRSALLDGIGLVAEDAPGGQNEDWDLLLRASRRRPIVHCDEPLVAVRWGSTSLFEARWETRIASLEWMLDRHPDIRGSPVGLARVYGQIAFHHAALGHRGAAIRWAWRSVRTRLGEPRGYLALAVACRLTSSDAVLRRLHRRGHGV